MCIVLVRPPNIHTEWRRELSEAQQTNTTKCHNAHYFRMAAANYMPFLVCTVYSTFYGTDSCLRVASTVVHVTFCCCWYVEREREMQDATTILKYICCGCLRVFILLFFFWFFLFCENNLFFYRQLALVCGR